jgi:hypothetical protein
MSFFASKSGVRQTAARTAVFAAVLLGTQTASFADNLGYRAYLQSFDPAKPTVSGVTVGATFYGLFGTDIVNAWNEFTTKVAPVWKDDLTKADYAGKGYTLEHPTPQISGVDSVEMRVAPVQDPLAPPRFRAPTTSAPVVVIHSTGTRIDAGSTTPNTTAGTDPTFHVTFDLTAYVLLGMGPRATEVTVPAAEVVVSNAQYFPDNATANEAEILGPLQNLFGARTFAQRVSDSLNGQTVDITGYLASSVRAADKKLLSLVPPGQVVSGIFADSRYLNAVFAPRLQPDAGGKMVGTLTVTGTSRLPAAQRNPPGYQDCSRAFSLSDTVQIQPDYVASLNPLSFIKGSGPSVSLDGQLSMAGGPIAPTADGWSCRYSVAGLADNFVNNVHFVRLGASGANNGSLPSFGYTIDVAFAGCTSNSAGGDLIRVSTVTCLATTPAICSDQLLPQSGQSLSCNLIGTIEASGNNGVGVIKQSVFANPSVLNPGGPVQSGSVAPGAWGAQNANRVATPGVTMAPQWGSAVNATASGAPAVGSSLRRGVGIGSSLQTQPASLGAHSALPSQY